MQRRSHQPSSKLPLRCPMDSQNGVKAHGFQSLLKLAYLPVSQVRKLMTSPSCEDQASLQRRDDGDVEARSMDPW